MIAFSFRKTSTILTFKINYAYQAHVRHLATHSRWQRFRTLSKREKNVPLNPLGIKSPRLSFRSISVISIVCVRTVKHYSQFIFRRFDQQQHERICEEVKNRKTETNIETIKCGKSCTFSACCHCAPD